MTNNNEHFPSMVNDTALPQAFETSTRRLFGEARYERFREALQLPPQTTIRLNPFKWPVREPQDKKILEPVPWCAEGFSLPHRPDFTFDPLLHAGAYYVQESSSMFVSHVVKHLVTTPVTVLDLCAAPGGKTTTLRASLPAGSIVVANEPMKVRASILSENVQKQGHPDVIVTNNYPRDFRKAGITFDFILADVPCSGEGMFRKDPQAVGEWSPQNVANCAQLQRSIIEDIWPTLRPGGFLVYSTCTFNEQEDEENIRWIVDNLGGQLYDIPVDPQWHITGALGSSLPTTANGKKDESRQSVFRFIPGFTPGEGLFMAVLQKPQAETLDQPRKKRPTSLRIKPSSSQKAVLPWLMEDPALGKNTWTVIDTPTLIRAIPTRWLPLYEKASDALHLIHAGVGIGTSKGKDIVPSASLALSTMLNPAAFPRVEIGWEQAMLYLRKEAIALPDGTHRGLVLVTYRGLALGFCKNIGNRANNLFPQEWKIKTTHLPEQASDVI